MTGIFEPNLDTIEMFLTHLGERELVMTATDTGPYVTVTPPFGPRSAQGVPAEVLRSLQPFLKHCWFGAVQLKGKKASKPYLCAVCENWSLQTTERSKGPCRHCGSKDPRHEIVLPWAQSNRYNRPPNHPLEVET